MKLTYTRVALMTTIALANQPIFAASEMEVPIQISVGNSTAQASYSLLEMGLVASNATSHVELTVTNNGERTIVLDAFALGAALAAEWKIADEHTGLKTRSLLRKGEAKVLLVDMIFDESSFHEIMFSTGGRSVAVVNVDYRISPPTYCRDAGMGGVPSAYGGGMGSYYTICLGKAYPGYELDTQRLPVFHVQESRLSLGHGRQCFQDFTDCQRVQEDSENVCWKVSIQGHHKDGAIGRDPENQIVYADATLTAWYRLKEHPEPRLLSGDALAKALSSPPLESNERVYFNTCKNP